MIELENDEYIIEEGYISLIEDIDDYIYFKDYNERIGIIYEINFDNRNINVSFLDDNEYKKMNMSDIKEIIKNNSELKVGDKVKIDPVFFKYEKFNSNPFDVEGEIIDNSGFWTHVLWNNGYESLYEGFQASLIKIK